MMPSSSVRSIGRPRTASIERRAFASPPRPWILRGDDRVEVALAAIGLDEQIQPERRSARSLPQLDRLSSIAAPAPAEDESDAIGAIQRTQVQRRRALSFAEGGRQGGRESVGDRRRSRRDDEGEAAAGPCRRANEEVTQRDRERVDPLQVVDEQCSRSEAGQLAMDRLEDADRIEPADLGVGIEQTDECPVLAGRGEPTEERCNGCERHAHLRLVAGEPQDPFPG